MEGKRAFSRTQHCGCRGIVLKCLFPHNEIIQYNVIAATDIFFKVIKAYLVIKGLGIKLGIPVGKLSLTLASFGW